MLDSVKTPSVRIQPWVMTLPYIYIGWKPYTVNTAINELTIKTVHGKDRWNKTNSHFLPQFFGRIYLDRWATRNSLISKYLCSSFQKPHVDLKCSTGLLGYTTSTKKTWGTTRPDVSQNTNNASQLLFVTAIPEITSVVRISILQHPLGLKQDVLEGLLVLRPIVTCLWITACSYCRQGTHQSGVRSHQRCASWRLMNVQPKKSNHTPAEKKPSKSVITEYYNTCRSLPNHHYSVLAICCVHTYMSIYMAMKDFSTSVHTKCIHTTNHPRPIYD